MTISSLGKMVYRLAEGGADKVSLLGGKGAHASEMARIGIPVPPGFIITTETSLEYFRLGRRFPNGLWGDIVAHVHLLEEETGRRFGDPETPLIVSVRSGAPVSMPGMMDTILNMGVTDATVDGLTKMMQNERTALDAFRRLLQGFGDVVLGIPKDRFETTLEQAKKQAGVEFDYELQPDALRQLIDHFKAIIAEATGEPVSSDPWVLLKQAVEAVFDSWNNPRAITYRNYQGISHDMGTACVIMAMVFGNLGDDSGTGVLFSRSPRRASVCCTASSCPTHRARMSSPAYAPPNASARCKRRGLRYIERSRRRRAVSRRITQTCRTSSSRLSGASSTSSRRGQRSGLHLRRSRSPSTWPRRAC